MVKEAAIVPGMKINVGVIEIIVRRRGMSPDTWIIKQFASGIGRSKAIGGLSEESTVTEKRLLEIMADASIHYMQTNRSQSASRMPETKKPLNEIMRAQFRLAHKRSLLTQPTVA